MAGKRKPDRKGKDGGNPTVREGAERESVGALSVSITPGFSQVIGTVKRRGNRLNGFQSYLAQRTWLKPGVNEIGWPKDLLCKAAHREVLK